VAGVVLYQGGEDFSSQTLDTITRSRYLSESTLTNRFVRLKSYDYYLTSCVFYNVRQVCRTLPASVRYTSSSLRFGKLLKAFLFVWRPRRPRRWSGALKWTGLT